MKFENKQTKVQDPRDPSQTFNYADLILAILRTRDSKRGMRIELMRDRLALLDDLEAQIEAKEVELTPKQAQEVQDAIREHSFPVACGDMIQFGTDLGII